MGHTDPATFSPHYHAGVPRAEAKKFWAVRPKRSKPGNVIQFKEPPSTSAQPDRTMHYALVALEDCIDERFNLKTIALPCKQPLTNPKEFGPNG